jgi:hypothetical protein
VCHGYDSICQGGLQFPYFVRYEAVRVDAEPLKCVAVLILVKLLREVNSDTSPFLLLRATLIWNNVWVCAIGFPDRTTLSPPDQGPNLILVVTFVPVLLIKSLEEQMEYREETWDNHKKPPTKAKAHKRFGRDDKRGGWRSQGKQLLNRQFHPLGSRCP